MRGGEGWGRKSKGNTHMLIHVCTSFSELKLHLHNKSKLNVHVNCSLNCTQMITNGVHERT